ncbi:Eco57I restriction-modification methylase domain-containing protein [Porphyromonas cangingivalis]|uniref:Eco57I restriction-modification methylase domain-containing protein n=1 Tax=Porphyromonas cangingivalis TaxID=36874 RepID=UPI00242AA997|nr:DNA methyltransferase [Porphyromonas cangingivalis]
MKKSTFQSYIREANFRELFITEMGWNNYQGQAALPPIVIEDAEYQFMTIAERNGFQILLCEVEVIPSASLCRNIDTKLRRSAHDYIAIYVQRGTEHHLWKAPVRQVEKRNIVTIEYETVAQADFLYSKIDDLSFDLDEQTTIVDVKQRIQQTFAINSEKITKDFYAGFKREHDAFAKFIEGIDDEITDLKNNRNKQWYTSIMLNRLMFCYFIQKKGFLDGNVNYLRDKLEWCQQQRGENQFFKSFYQGFLVQLFQDGLNAPRHEREFERIYGKIPYLNGGMFDQHQIERDYQDIDIDDAAFERLFDFFDKWRWHLDTRISASGKDINPDVLGYIFEQYINDRAQMGAYYTKEDITEYIGRNCILPFLLDKVAGNTPKAFAPKGEVWKRLQQSGDRYLFDAVKQGYTANWRTQIPENIARGLDTIPLNLLERRKDWNTRTPEPYALPTEIWRETIERLQRCEDIIGKISQGDIREVNDFITYNLDIRRFTQDLLEQTDDHLLVAHFYHALQQVTILDPTCGSGAFLFAALNILEPLYEVCISRMEEFNQQNPHLFKDELAEIAQKYRSNIQYFIYKSIILRNLYGVDIMAEAVEIAKLRLFLKMVAVVEADRRAPNLGLDPLPDIDFNIRCGNTLVGYASEEEVVGAYSSDLFTAAAFREQMEVEMTKVAKAYEHFRRIQLSQHEDMAEFKEAKEELRTRLTAFTEQLNRQMYSTHLRGAEFKQEEYDAYLASHQPFHWFAEYYQIIHGNRGFDVIIGNPPYVEYNKVKKIYSLDEYCTINSGNIYAMVLERGDKLTRADSVVGWIVPISVVSTNRTISLQEFLLKKYGAFISSFDIFPSKLFEGVAQRVSIVIGSVNWKSISLTKYYRWRQDERGHLFQCIRYYTNDGYVKFGWIARYNCITQKNILHKLSDNKELVHTMYSKIGNTIYVHRIINNFIKAIDFEPYFKKSDGVVTHSPDFKEICVDPKYEKLIIGILNSNLFYWYWRIHGDGFHCGFKDIEKMPFSINQFQHSQTLNSIVDLLIKDLDKNSKIKVRRQTSTGDITLQTFFVGESKPIIDEIDKVLAEHYGFTEEELDFIINYDIKYRMGDELNGE